MNKKFISAILFGALMVGSTGTFTSCKDYDDDISNLQEQIDGQKGDLSTKLSAVESSISSLQSAQSGLQSAIDAAKNDAEKAALAAQNKAIETAKAELETVKTELQAAIKANADDIEAVKAIATKAEEDMAKAIGRIETLEAFKATTTETLNKLAEADAALSAQITSLSEELKAELTELGKRLTAVEAQIAALESYKTTNDAAVSGNKEAIEQLIADLKALEEGQLTEAKVQEIAEKVTEAVSADLDLISAAFNKKVTHVSLYVRTQDAYNNYWYNLNLVSAEAVRTWTFGENLGGTPVSFKKGSKEAFDESFLIRVSPTNATLDKSMIKLINSQLNDLSGLLEIKDIEPYKELVTTRGVSQNGLWKVTVKLADDYDTEAYKEAASTYNEDGSKLADILYAVMIGDDVKNERQVVSEYGIVLGQNDKDALRQLYFNVDKQSVTNIKNRWRGSVPSYSEAGSAVNYEELAWSLDGKNKPWAEPILIGQDKNVLSDNSDARQYRAAYSVKAGQPFTVNFSEVNAKSVRAFYVTLDEACATESQPSEINAWKSYKIKGLNTVTTESSIELTVPTDVNADGDYIGLRVYAVNYDGSLVDPDGKAFYIYVGETAESQANLVLSMAEKTYAPWLSVDAANPYIVSEKDNFSTLNWGRAQNYDLEITDNEGKIDGTTGVSLSNFIFRDADGNVISLYSTDKAKAVTVEMQNVEAARLKDNVTYTATITARNNTSGIVAVGTVTFTKKLPGFPTTVYPFTGQLINNNLKVYPVLENGLAQYQMTSSWHGIAGSNGAGYEGLLFKEIVAQGKTATLTYDDAVTKIQAPITLVNPEDKAYETKFPMSIVYSYGKISYDWDATANSYLIKDHTTSWGTNFTIQIGNYVDDCTYSMSGVTVNYPGAVGKDAEIALNKITVKDWYNDAINLSKIGSTAPGDATSKEVKFFDVVETGVPFKVEFLTGDNFDRVDEYFEFKEIKNSNIVMTSKSDAAQGQTVKTKLRLIFKDKFGYTVQKVVDGTFDMKFQK